MSIKDLSRESFTASAQRAYRKTKENNDGISKEM